MSLLQWNLCRAKIFLRTFSSVFPVGTVDVEKDTKENYPRSAATWMSEQDRIFLTVSIGRNGTWVRLSRCSLLRGGLVRWHGLCLVLKKTQGCGGNQTSMTPPRLDSIKGRDIVQQAHGSLEVPRRSL